MVRLVGVIAALAVGTACNLVEYDSINEACGGGLAGEEHLDGGSAAYPHRFNCFRRFVNLNGLEIDEAVQRAVRDHADYVRVNGILDPASDNFGKGGFYEQNRRLAQYIGGNALSRLRYHDAVPADVDFKVWEVMIRNVDERPADFFIDVPWYREVLFQPDVLGFGYAEFETAGETWAYFNVLHAYPTTERNDWPVVYPENNQTNVPVSYAPADVGDNPLYVAERIGYPISVTLTSMQIEDSADPYHVRVAESSLYGPEGKVPLITVRPGYGPLGPNPTTVVFAPAYVLQPNSTYTFRAVLNWNTRTGHVVEATFHTGDGEVVEMADELGAPPAMLPWTLTP